MRLPPSPGLLPLPSRLSGPPPVHGSAPDIAGKGIANPVACVRSGAMLLEYLHEPQTAARIHRAVQRTLDERFTTPDLGGSRTTQEVTDKIIEYL